MFKETDPCVRRSKEGIDQRIPPSSLSLLCLPPLNALSPSLSLPRSLVVFPLARRDTKGKKARRREGHSHGNNNSRVSDPRVAS